MLAMPLLFGQTRIAGPPHVPAISANMARHIYPHNRLHTQLRHFTLARYLMPSSAAAAYTGHRDAAFAAAARSHSLPLNRYGDHQ